MSSAMPKYAHDAVREAVASSRRVARVTRSLAAHVDSAELNPGEFDAEDTLVTSIKALCDRRDPYQSGSGKTRR